MGIITQLNIKSAKKLSFIASALYSTPDSFNKFIKFGSFTLPVYNIFLFEPSSSFSLGKIFISLDEIITLSTCLFSNMLKNLL